MLLSELHPAAGGIASNLFILPRASAHHFPTKSASLPRMFFRASLPGMLFPASLLLFALHSAQRVLSSVQLLFEGWVHD